MRSIVPGVPSRRARTDAPVSWTPRTRGIHMGTWRRGVVGSVAAAVVTAALAAAMVPIRSHLSIATTGLVLVVPVVTGVVVGGFAAGAFAVVAGFLVFDLVFIPPYLTLTVGTGENWVVLVVYVAVMLLVASVV